MHWLERDRSCIPGTTVAENRVKRQNNRIFLHNIQHSYSQQNDIQRNRLTDGTQHNDIKDNRLNYDTQHYVTRH